MSKVLKHGGARSGAGRLPRDAEGGAANYTLGVRLTASLRTRLEEAARKTGQKKADIAREAIEKYIENLS